MKTKFIVVFVLIALLTFSTSVFASLIKYEIKGLTTFGLISVNDVGYWEFPDKTEFKFTMIGDTNNIQNFGEISAQSIQTATVSVGAYSLPVDLGSLSSPLSVNRPTGYSWGDLFLWPENPPTTNPYINSLPKFFIRADYFKTYDLGPTAGPISGILHDFDDWGYVVNSFGSFWFNPINMSQASFQATPVPEPATILLLGSGLVGLAGFGKRKFKKK